MTFADMLLALEPNCPGIDRGEALLELRLALRRFCARTEAWVLELPAIDLVAGTSAYYLVPPHDADVRRVLAVTVNTADGVTAGLDGVELGRRGWTFTPRTNALELAEEPAASVTDGLVATVVLVPSATAEDADETLLDRWGDACVAGALSMILRRPQSAHANPAGAAFWEGEYLRQTVQARREEQLAHGPGACAMEPG